MDNIFNNKIFKILYNIIVCIIIILISFIIWYLKVNFTLAKDLDSIREKFVPSPVIATIKKDGSVYLDEGLKKYLADIYTGDKVEIIRDRGTNIYYIKSYEHNIKGWVSKHMLDIPPTPPASDDLVSNEEIEIYIKDIGIKSKTQYILFTDIYRQYTYVLKNGNVIRKIRCSTGLNESPTIRGIYSVKDRGKWFYSERFKSGAMNWIRIDSSYLFHSVPMDNKKNIIDDRLHTRCSHGCIRMGIDDIIWLYDNIKEGTTVYIY